MVFPVAIIVSKQITATTLMHETVAMELAYTCG